MVPALGGALQWADICDDDDHRSISDTIHNEAIHAPSLSTCTTGALATVAVCSQFTV